MPDEDENGNTNEGAIKFAFDVLSKLLIFIAYFQDKCDFDQLSRKCPLSLCHNGIEIRNDIFTLVLRFIKFAI